jgi:hypothetical protein
VQGVAVMASLNLVIECNRDFTTVTKLI